MTNETMTREQAEARINTLWDNIENAKTDEECSHTLEWFTEILLLTVEEDDQEEL